MPSPIDPLVLYTRDQKKVQAKLFVRPYFEKQLAWVWSVVCLCSPIDTGVCAPSTINVCVLHAV